MSRLSLQPITFEEAAAFIEQHHRHHLPPQGWKFGIAVNDGQSVRGVITVGRPVARTAAGGTPTAVTAAPPAPEPRADRPEAAPEPRPPRRRGGRPRADLPPKTCEVCSATFHRRTDDDGHVTEPSSSFRKRRTCSKRCGALLRERLRARPPAPDPQPRATPRGQSAWTPDQVAILERTYPHGGAQAAREALAAAGHPVRTIATIRVKAQRIGVTAGPRADDTPEDERVLSLVRDYRGLPLTVDDIHDELHLKRTHARHILERLTEAGHLHSEPDLSFNGRGQVPIIYRAKEADQCSTT